MTMPQTQPACMSICHMAMRLGGRLGRRASLGKVGIPTWRTWAEVSHVRGAGGGGVGLLVDPHLAHVGRIGHPRGAGAAAIWRTWGPGAPDRGLNTWRTWKRLARQVGHV